MVFVREVGSACGDDADADTAVALAIAGAVPWKDEDYVSDEDEVDNNDVDD